MTLPAFEVPIAPPPVQASPAEQPAPVAPAAPAQANPFMASSQANPSAPPSPFVQANPFREPAQVNPFKEHAQAKPFAESVRLSPSERPPQVSPSERPPQVSPSERPVYPNLGAQADDVNPIVRPVHGSSSVRPLVAEPVHLTPSAPPVVAVPAVAVASAQPVVEEPVQASLSGEPPKVEPVHTPAAPALVEPKMIDAPIPTAPVTATIDAPVHASAVEVPLADAAAVEAHAPPNAFETAPTAFAGSETPIARADAEPTLTSASAEQAAPPDQAVPAEGPVAEQAAASAWIETPAPPNAESVVAEGEIQEQAPSAPQPFPAARSFTSSGSEMPVVITTPAPYQRSRNGSTSNLFDLGREFLPRAQAWSRKTLRTTPRTLIISAPLVALFGIWAVRSLVSHPKHAAVAETTTDSVAQVAAATPPPQGTAAVSVTTPASAILASNAAPSAAAPGADPTELASAVAHGLPALEALAQKFPNDAQVGIALASQQAQAQRFEAAVDSVERVIVLDSKSAQNGKVMGILWRAAQSSASEQSFSALRKLGGRGSDIAFDLAVTAGVRDAVRERAKTELGNSLSAEASADTRVATALLLAPDCGARKALLARAEREGGKRTQAMLERFSRGSVCTSTTDKACNACLTGSPALTHALAQLSAGGQK
ncbi:MAG TPA: hypothetical protein VGC79_07695 [Polyangiaceae bacterium]